MPASSAVRRIAAVAVVAAPLLVHAQRPPLGSTDIGRAVDLTGSRIAVVVGGRSMSDGFTFGLGSQRVTFAAGSWTGFTYEAPKFFPAALVKGAPFSVTQVDGPRTCTLHNQTGTAGVGTTIYVYADCNAQPTKFTLGIRVSGTSDGESVTFATDGGDQLTQTAPVRQSFLANGLPSGATVRVWRVGNVPARACTLTGDAPWAITTIGDTVVVRGYSDVYITARCPAPPVAQGGGSAPTPGAPGGGSRGPSGTILPPSSRIPVPAGARTGPGTSALGGIVNGPLGARATLLVNGGSPLPVTIPVPPYAGAYNDVPFTFTPLRPNGSLYAISATTTNANLTCMPYQAAFGIMPAAGNPVRVGCETIFSHVSTNTAGTVRATFYETKDAVIGGAAELIGSGWAGWGEGRFVAFVSNATGLTDKKTTVRQVYFHDRMTGETMLLSAAPDGTPGNADSYAPAISADGLTIAFESDATNLVSGDGNGVRDVFVWSAAGGTYPTQVDRVSVGASGAAGNAASGEATVSGDGRVVAFTSTASNLTGAVPGTETPNVFRRDLKARTTTLVTRGLKGAAVGGSRPSISEDGMRIAFQSSSSALVPNDRNGLWDIFVYDHTTAGLQRVSVAEGGAERNQGDESASRVVSPSLSGDGNVVAFATTATNLVPGVTKPQQNVYVVHLRTGRIAPASVTSTGVEADGNSPVEQGGRPALSFSGEWVAFASTAKNLGALDGNLFLHNTITGETRPLTTMTNNSPSAVSMTRTGAYVVFGSNNRYDTRVTSSGVFVKYTGLANAMLWIP